ncbi:hypothetical protein ACP26L_07825 [Paenibacillus sp. S-38]|uniref:hypothetical protein n=1 Tax=Paenibacillus sp. S-38 TaxID=3416710 RepID=UPI003CF92DC6
MDGGLEVRKQERLLYFNKRPLCVTVKTAFALSEFYDTAYSEVVVTTHSVVATGTLTVPSGSEFYFSDVYESSDCGFKVSRSVKVLKAGDDLGFSTKISLVMAESDNTRDYNYFAPGVWYKQNEYAPDHSFGKDLDCDYYWRMETNYALPLFAMQNIASGEMAASIECNNF